MKVQVDMDENDIRDAIRLWVEKKTGVNIFATDVVIQVKSKQNWKAEWEVAKFKASFSAAQNEGGW